MKILRLAFLLLSTNAQFGGRYQTKYYLDSTDDKYTSKEPQILTDSEECYNGCMSIGNNFCQT